MLTGLSLSRVGAKHSHNGPSRGRPSAKRMLRPYALRQRRGLHRAKWVQVGGLLQVCCAPATSLCPHNTID